MSSLGMTYVHQIYIFCFGKFHQKRIICYISQNACYAFVSYVCTFVLLCSNNLYFMFIFTRCPGSNSVHLKKSSFASTLYNVVSILAVISKKLNYMYIYVSVIVIIDDMLKLLFLNLLFSRHHS